MSEDARKAARAVLDQHLIPDYLGPNAIPESTVRNLTTDLALKAPLASPTFTGIPIVPTASVDTNTTQAASTAFVIGQLMSSTSLTGNINSQIDNRIEQSLDSYTVAGGEVTGDLKALKLEPIAARNVYGINSLIDNRIDDALDAYTVAGGDVTGKLSAHKLIPSVSLPGSPTTTTQSPSDNSTRVATTAYADAAATAASSAPVLFGSADSMIDNKIEQALDSYTIAGGDVTGSLAAPKFSGLPNSVGGTPGVFGAKGVSTTLQNSAAMAFDPILITTSVTLGDGLIRGCMVYLPYRASIKGVGFYLTTSGVYTADNSQQVAVWRFTANGSGMSLVGSVTSTTVFKGSAGTFILAPIISAADGSTPFLMDAGIYYIGFLANWSAVTTAPQLGCGAAFISTAVCDLSEGGYGRFFSLTGAVASIPDPLGSATARANNTSPVWASLVQAN